MKKPKLLLFGLLFCMVSGLGLSGCGVPDDHPGKARFFSFTYHGKDKIYEDFPLDGTNFHTPILQGFYPDPSITRKGDNYYLVASTFVYFPGVPIFESEDLVNWRQIGHILDRPSQLQLDEGLRVSQGIYAPTIRYNPHDDTFYMITTCVGGRNGGNFVVKTQDPAGDWSDPIWLPQINGIDPDLFFDEDGKAYIVHNGEPDGQPLYDGHRAVRIWEYDTSTDRIIGGGAVIVNGGVNLADKPIWIEAPHIYKRGENYYLMCAEGGTSTWHSEVVFQAKNIWGPYIPAAENPILTQRHLRDRRVFEVTSAGHADIAFAPEGDRHYAVFLAVRPYEGNMYNTGRETFILPLDWNGEFPVFEGGLEPLAPTLPLPTGVENKTGREGFLPNGNWIYTEEFDGPELDQRWMMLRTPQERFYCLDNGSIVLEPRPVNIRERKNPSMVAYRQQHTAFEVETVLRFTPETENDLAGLVCFQNDDFHFVLGVTLVGGQKTLILEKTEKGESEILVSAALEKPNADVTLKIKGDGRYYSFGYTTGRNTQWLAEHVDASLLSTQVAGGFTGNVFGLYATSQK